MTKRIKKNTMGKKREIMTNARESDEGRERGKRWL